MKAAINISTLRVNLVAKLWSQISQERSEFELRNDEEETQRASERARGAPLCARAIHSEPHFFAK